jgi:hypothetical protein
MLQIDVLYRFLERTVGGGNGVVDGRGKGWIEKGRVDHASLTNEPLALP